MLPIERQKQILLWLEEEVTLKVSDISSKLNVSEMTIYRDIKPLIDQQKIVKTSNGITLTKEISLTSNHHCSYCYKDINTRLSVQLIKLNHQVEQTCCIHCGLLRYKDIQQEVAQIICRDFLHDTTLSAKTGFFLINPDFHTNCCQPHVLTFNSMDEAHKFQRGFGGDICNFEQIIEALNSQMQSSACCHQKHEEKNGVN